MYYILRGTSKHCVTLFRILQEIHSAKGLSIGVQKYLVGTFFSLHTYCKEGGHPQVL